MRLRAIVACLLLTALAGCSEAGNEDDEGAGGGVASSGAQSSQAGGTTTAAGSTTAAAPDFNVEMYDNRYDPTTLAVPNYQKVVFENKGTLSHTVTIVRQGDPAGTTYRDQAVQTGANVDYNFPNDGTYTVYCRYHGSETSGMRMTITV